MQTNCTLTPICLFPCVYLAITKATLVTLKLASRFLLMFSLKLPCTWSFHTAYRDCWTGESIYLQERAASFLVRLLIEGIDFIVRAKWHLSGNRHVESHLLCVYLYAVLLETLLYGVCLPRAAQAEKLPFWTLHFRFSSYWMSAVPLLTLIFDGVPILCLQIGIFAIYM